MRSTLASLAGYALESLSSICAAWDLLATNADAHLNYFFG